MVVSEVLVSPSIHPMAFLYPLEMSSTNPCLNIPKYRVRHLSRDAATGFQPQLADPVSVSKAKIMPSTLLC